MTIKLIILVIALICALLAAAGVSDRLGWLALGLFILASML